jgi:predicted metal-dependent enzyme (double-stranded beta helix superfamily)
MAPTATSLRTRPGLDRLVSRIHEGADLAGPARRTAFAVADLMRAEMPGVDVLTPEERAGDPTTYSRVLLHTEERLSVIAVVWRPGQLTEIHDHIAWCTVGVIQGVEFETLYRDHGDHLIEIGRAANGVGDVSGFAPPGDIHRVHNTGDETAISLHVYGADLSVSPSSVRREYHLPIR